MSSDQADEAKATSAPTTTAAQSPNLAYLADNFQQAISSFYATVARIISDNPVDITGFSALAGKASQGTLETAEQSQFAELKLQALRQGRAVGAVIGFF